MGLLTILCFLSTLSWLPSLLRFVFHIQWTVFNDPLSPLQLPSTFRRAVIGTAHSLPRTDTPGWQAHRSLNTESLMEAMINLGLLPWDDGLSPCRQPSIVRSTWALRSAELYLNPRLLLTVGPRTSYWILWASVSLSAEKGHSYLIKCLGAWLPGFESQFCQLLDLGWVT